MKIEVRVEPDCDAPRVVIITNEMNEEIQALVKKLSAGSEERLTHIIGFRDGSAELLEPSEVIRVYGGNQKVFAMTSRGEYILKARLYELEEALVAKDFVRISHSEIINLKQVEKFDLNLSGVICVKLKNGQTTYVARRYVGKMKKTLGL